jgi:transposase-like protein
MNTAPQSPDRFPCPFCRAARVRVTGQTESFVHYVCSECAEVWTAMSFRPRTERRRWSESLASRRTRLNQA